MAKAEREGDLPAGVIGRVRSFERHDSHVRPKAPPSGASDGQTEAIRHAQQRSAALVDALEAATKDEIAPIVRQLLPLGVFALEALTQRFPGELWSSRSINDRFPAPEELSAIAAALVTFDSECVPYLVRLLQNPNPHTRYYAGTVARYVQHEKLVGSLVRLALDEDRTCRRVATDALGGYRSSQSFEDGLGMLRRVVANDADSSERRQHAVRALTQLRDAKCVSLLIDLLQSEDLRLASAARVGLRLLTGHDYAFSRASWVRWLAERGSLHRIEWLIRALSDSRSNLRELAAQELWRETRVLRPLGADATREAYARARRQYQEWWGRQLLFGNLE